MPFEARKTKFTVFSFNHELYNLIKLGRKRLKLIKQGNERFTHDRSAYDVAFLPSLRGHVLLANSNVPDVLKFRTSGKLPCHLYNRFFSKS